MRAMIPRPWVILLAAGGSRRFGRPKQLAQFEGESLLRRSARVALACRPSGCVVVLGANAARLRRELKDLPVAAVVNRRWRSGMAGSLRTALAALPGSARSALVLLADQPGVGPAELELLIAAWRRRPRSIVTACAAGVRCPPAIFPREWFTEMRRLRGDVGARALLSRSPRRVIELDMPVAALDIDRPDDLDRFGGTGVVS